MKIAVMTALVALGIAGAYATSSHAGSPPVPQDRKLATKVIQYELQINATEEGSPQYLKLQEAQGALLDQMAETDFDGYETLRENMRDNAPTVNEFARWATEEEIVADMDLSPAEQAELERNALIEMTSTASAPVLINVYIGSQSMDMSVNGTRVLSGPVATARPGYSTPRGCRKPWLLNKTQYSTKYHAPMPNSVFFVGGVALHTGNVRVKSHGCVHLNPAASLQVFNTVKKFGMSKTVVCVH